MATLPVWAVGRHITAYTLTPCTADTAGVLTEITGSAQALYGHLENVEVESRRTTENISAMDRQFENHVTIENGTVYRVTELGKSNGINKLASAGYAYDYFKVLLTRGGQSWTGYALIGNYRMVANKRSVHESAELLPVDVGSTNPAYA